MPVEEEVDPFQTSKGGWDDLNVVLKNARFGFNPAYHDTEGNLILALLVNMETDDGEVGTLEDQVLTIGKGWEAIDGGKSVRRTDGKTKGYNNLSYMGLILDACMELAGDKMRDRYEKTGLKPTDAGFWEGLQCHMVQKEIPGFKKGDPPKSKLLPDKIVGWEAPKAKKKAAAKKAPTPVARTEEDEGVSPEMLALIVEVAKTSGDEEEFLTRAYTEVEGLDSNTAAMELVDDTDSPESVWQVHGAGAQGADGDEE